jgi:hypothetical protein
MYESCRRKIGKITSHSIEEDSPSTNYILLLDAMAKRYGVLPTNILAKGDTFDLMVFDVAVTTEVVNSYKEANKPLPPELYNKTQVDKLAEQYYGNKSKR